MTASTPSIVLVDDEPELRNMLQLYFAQQGLTLTGIAGAEGLRTLMASQTMDLVFLSRLLQRRYNNLPALEIFQMFNYSEICAE